MLTQTPTLLTFSVSRSDAGAGLSGGREKEGEDSSLGYPTPITHEKVEVTEVI